MTSALHAPALVAAPLAALLALSSSAAAQDPDLTVLDLHLVQAIQDGTVPISADRSTMARIVVDVAGTLPPGAQVDGILRVFEGGVEASYSPIYSRNGPYTPPSNPLPTNIDDTLNFVFIPRESLDVTFEIEVNPAGPNQVAESDYSNNTMSIGPLPILCKQILELAYFPINYMPGGSPTPGLPNPLLIEPGVGDNFIQAIYPGPDWEYHRIDAPSKTWTGSLSGSGSSLNNSTSSDLQQMFPKPDFGYSWIAGGLPYNGMAGSNTAMGNTQPFKHQRTFAHEIGHLLGKGHNSTNLSSVGVDVEHHLAITQGLSVTKGLNLKDIMAPGLNTNQAFVAKSNYAHFTAHNKYGCPVGVTSSTSIGERQLVAGLWDPTLGTIEWTDVFVPFKGQETPTVPLHEADLIQRVFVGGALVAELGISAHAHANCADPASGFQTSPEIGFVTVLPGAIGPDTVQRVEFVDARTGLEVGSLARSANPPQVAITSPAPGELIGDDVQLRWTASDADGDPLRFYVVYSHDGVRRSPIASRLTDTDLAVSLVGMPTLVPGQGYLEVVATDGLNTRRVRTAPLHQRPHAVSAGGNAPWAHILTPDDNTSFANGSNVILHSSGWDLEDRALTGGSIAWFSDVDGPIGTGRVTDVTTLSVGTHVIEVQATDGQGLVTTDTATVAILDRPLPGAPAVTCQNDLGFGGPGSSVLTLCGDDLSPGTTADLELTGAAPSAPAWLAVALANNPAPLLGGTIVPLPTILILGGVTDVNGDWAVATVDAGLNPATVYMQAAYLDASFVDGLGFSNALEVVLHP